MTTSINGSHFTGMVIRSQITYNKNIFYNFVEIFKINILLKSLRKSEIMSNEENMITFILGTRKTVIVLNDYLFLHLHIYAIQNNNNKKSKDKEDLMLNFKTNITKLVLLDQHFCKNSL